MKLFFSGQADRAESVEMTLHKPCVMMSYFYLQAYTKKDQTPKTPGTAGKRFQMHEDGKTSVGKFFLDSGAHSLYMRETINKSESDKFLFFETDEFWKYVDDYASFLKKHLKSIDYYANVDVIFNPKLSWKVLKYLESKGLNPIPVVHHNTPMKWLHRHLKEGYKYIGFGGLGQKTTKAGYHRWADRVFQTICDNPKKIPCVKAHGFAMTSYDLLIRYPWFSTDSVSWAKSAGFGSIFVPHKRNGKFTFDINPYVIAISMDSPSVKVLGKHISTIPRGARKIIHEWLDQINMPLGRVNKKGESIEYGVRSEYNARAVANLKFFEALCNWLPKWPWPFTIEPEEGFFSWEEVS